MAELGYLSGTSYLTTEREPFSVSTVADQQAISRVAKILARATSSEYNEANTALQAAYKRMRRDGVGIKDLLSLPLTELYQEPLVKLVMVILEDQSDLSPPERRKAFETYMSMITVRFAESDDPDAPHGQRRDAPAANQEAEAKQQKRREEERRKEEARRSAQSRASEEQQRAKQREEEVRREQVRRDKEETARNAAETSRGQAGGPLVAVAAVCTLIVGIVVYAPSESGLKSPNAGPKTETVIRVAPQSVPTHAIAALKANLRSGPTANSTVVATLARGESLTMISEGEAFVQIRTASGQIGYVARDLMIPFQDLARLANLTGQQYVEGRKAEKRIEALLTQTEHLTLPFVIVLEGLTKRSRYINKGLENLQNAKNLTLESDASAATWFALSARISLESGAHESAYWDARAAIEAEPTNAEHHVAFGLANYRAGNFEVVKEVGKVLPRLAPTSTNAWMIFALGQSLEEEPQNELTTAALVLAIRLSRNAEATRRYFQALAESAKNQRTRELLHAALAEEREHPELFFGVDALHTSVSLR